MSGILPHLCWEWLLLLKSLDTLVPAVVLAEEGHLAPGAGVYTLTALVSCLSSQLALSLVWPWEGSYYRFVNCLSFPVASSGTEPLGQTQERTEWCWFPWLLL